MARPKKNIILPRIIDNNGDLSKKWYVEYSVRDPKTDKLNRYREYTGFDKLKTSKERYAHGKKIIARIKDELAMGKMPYMKETISYQDQLIYANVARRWGCEKEGKLSIRSLLSEFLLYKEPTVNEKSLQTYRSKCRIFCEWIESNNFGELPAASISNDIICDYIIYIALEYKLSTRTIDKYIQIIHTFFDWLLKKKKLIVDNPVHDLPKVGSIKDEAARPIPEHDRHRLMQLIQDEDQQLHLVCSMIYYAAIRPNECRLLKVGDIDFEHNCIRVPNTISKNSQTEVVIMPHQLADELRSCGIESWKNKEHYVFGKYRCPGSECLGKNTLRNRFNVFRKRLGLSDTYKLYSFKHTGGINLIQQGINPWALKEHFRHKSITTTERYLKNQRGTNCAELENNFPDL